MALGSQALAQAEIDKGKAANPDITNWQDNITGGGTDQGAITASGDKAATRKVEKMAESNSAFLRSFNNKTDIAKAKAQGWDISDRKQLLEYIDWKEKELGYKGKKVNLSANWNNSAVVTKPKPKPVTNNQGGGGTNNQGGGSGASSQSGVTINNNITNSGYTGNNPATNSTPRPTNPAGGKNIDEMLGRQSKVNTFKKTTGLPDAGRGSKTPYKFRGLENQFQSWQMQHYNNQDTTT